ncbi:hypothetical protein DP163_gp019 [Sea otter poxvirus]|uniref:Uncharacterized protein n=1 Tax=Sea otter poxvirus TaxID=1416741 RepID=A0A2U9QHI6_9POXV|nr:hypothetical protein DP163_gp019 [Sea otter poxvirus]AWU47064.1 hypothetical protein [Sea otter poxvirus]
MDNIDIILIVGVSAFVCVIGIVISCIEFIKYYNTIKNRRVRFAEELELLVNV